MPLGSLEQVIFRVNSLHAAAAKGLPIFNSPRSLEIAIDKWLTLELATRAGIKVPKTIVCQTREQAMQAFEDLSRDVVVKPIFGGEGRGIMRVSCSDLAWRVFGTLQVGQSVIYLQEFIEHGGQDIRVFLIGEETYSIRRTNQSSWKTNLACGAKASVHHPSSAELEMAGQAAAATETLLAGVDLIRDHNGQLYLLEVNAVPGWKGLAKTLDVDISRKVLDYIRRSA